MKPSGDPNHNDTSGETLRRGLVELWGKAWVVKLERECKKRGITLKELIQLGIEDRVKEIGGKN